MNDKVKKEIEIVNNMFKDWSNPNKGKMEYCEVILTDPLPYRHERIVAVVIIKNELIKNGEPLTVAKLKNNNEAKTMYKITINNNSRKGSTEIIRANFWLAYHALHSLYGVEESSIDEAFKIAEKEPCEIRFNNKTFTVEIPKMSSEQMRNDLHLSISVLTSEISMAEDEDRQYVKLERGFVTQLQKVLSKILKNM